MDRCPDVSARDKLLRALAPANISAVYVLAVLVAVFGWLRPHTFLTSTTLTSVLSDQAITALVAIGLVIPLAADLFDLSVAGAVALGAVTSASLAAKHGQPAAVAITIAIAVGLAVGVIAGLLVTRIGISSFIATLGIGSILTALADAVSNQQVIIGLPSGFTSLGSNQLFGVRWVVWIVLGIALIAWAFLEHMPAGRHLYAIGDNLEAARLNGIRVDLLRVVALAASATIAATAGVLATAGVGAGSTQTGPAYLLPAFAAVFLGSTQVTAGRVNVWGTVLAVYVLAIGVKGLELSGAPFWLSDFFNGAALLVSVGLAGKQLRLFRRRGASPAAPAPQAAETASTAVS